MPLSLFRRKKQRETEPAPLEAAAPTTETEPLTAPEPAEEPVADGQSEDQASAPKRRRRGSRGGRGRKKKTEPAVEEAVDDVEPARAEPKPAGERKPRVRTPRRSAPRRAPLPKAKRELLVSVDAGEKRVGVLEDGRVVEVYLERPEQRSIAGNVYLGIVDNVLPGMEAAFVEMGLEKNGFLYVDEIVGPELEGRKGARKIQDLIQKGQTILVQAVKDPMKTKGARLTTEISLPGRFLVYVPHGDGLGVSRRLEEDERNRLKTIMKELAPSDGGVIVRTAAEGASAEDIARDLDFLQRLWRTIEARAEQTRAPALIYQEAELPLRVTRDLFTGDFERLLVDNERAHKRIVGYLKKTSPHMVERVTRYRDRVPLMEAFGVEGEIRSTLSRRVDLPSGGYLIFDYAEAFTVIDVNTGRFVGSRSKRSPGRLEDTITKNNLEAVKEVVRQLRLRDIGGIIVIDFIDMANPKNRAQVEGALREELERDRTKTYVVEISPLGLVEMTRQNVTDGPREVMTRKCPTCDGDGIVVSESTTAVEIERRLRALVTPGSRAKAFRVEVNARIASLVTGPGGGRLLELEETTKRRFFLVGLENVHLDHFKVVEQGTLEKLAPPSRVEPGEELTVKLGEVGLYDPHAGVGKLDGTEIRVANAARLVGKKVRARIAVVQDGVAYAEALEGVETAEPAITAEAEAERPTRARRASKRTEAVEDLAAPPAGEEQEAEVAPPAPGELELADGAAVEQAATKKRTRRGTRGGRGRKRKPSLDELQPAEANGGGGEAAHEAKLDEAAGQAPPEQKSRGSRKPTAEDETKKEGPAPRRPPKRAKVSSPEQKATAPVIHVPDPELGRSDDDGSPDGSEPAPRKRTRRGTRGGRNRRKKPGADAVAAGPARESPADDPAATHEASESQNGVGPARAEADSWDYTPMSEWGLDENG